MLHRAFAAALGGAWLLAGPALADGDAQAGATVFKQCALCHTNEAGKNKVGPSLFGVIGRQSASVPRYAYSDAMKKFDHVWDDETLQSYLTDPRKMVPGSKMVFVGLKDQKQRDDVIAYLKTLK